jgi:hypothetical protein
MTHITLQVGLGENSSDDLERYRPISLAFTMALLELSIAVPRVAFFVALITANSHSAECWSSVRGSETLGHGDPHYLRRLPK